MIAMVLIGVSANASLDASEQQNTVIVLTVRIGGGDAIAYGTTADSDLWRRRNGARDTLL